MYSLMISYGDSAGLTKFNIYRNGNDFNLYRLNMIASGQEYTVYVKSDSYKNLLSETNLFMEHFDKAISKYSPNTENNPHKIIVKKVELDSSGIELDKINSYTEPPFSHGYKHFAKPVSWTNGQRNSSKNQTVQGNLSYSQGCCSKTDYKSSYDNICCTTRGSKSSMRKRNVNHCCHRQRTR